MKVIFRDNGEVACFSAYGGPPTVFTSDKLFWWWPLLKHVMKHARIWRGELECLDERGKRL